MAVYGRYSSMLLISTITEYSCSSVFCPRRDIVALGACLVWSPSMFLCPPSGLVIYPWDSFLQYFPAQYFF